MPRLSGMGGAECHFLDQFCYADVLQNCVPFQTNKFIEWKHQYSLFGFKVQRWANPKPVNPGFQSLNFREPGKILPDTAGGWVWKQHTITFIPHPLSVANSTAVTSLLPVAKQSSHWAFWMLISRSSNAVTHSLFTELWMGLWALCKVFQKHSPCP